MILGWDLSTKLVGWCAGDGSTVPVAGAFPLSRRADLGELGAEFQGNALEIHKRFGATHWAVESPLLLPTDALWVLERLYGLYFLTHTLANKLGVPCHSATIWDVKRELAGRNADKAQMVAAARRLGVALPKLQSDGQEDAADGVGVWKAGVRKFAPIHLMWIDMALAGGGRLL